MAWGFVAGAGICDRLVLLSDRFSINDLRFATGFNLLSAFVDGFCTFGTADLLLSHTSLDIRAGLFSFFSDFFVSVSLLLVFDEDDNSFDLDLVVMGSGFFKILGAPCTEVPDALPFGIWSLFKLRLESLRSLRAEENPLLELVRFDICAFDDRSDFSLLNIFNLSSIECLVDVTAVPFATILPLLFGCIVYGLVGILQTFCCRKLKK